MQSLMLGKYGIQTELDAPSKCSQRGFSPFREVCYPGGTMPFQLGLPEVILVLVVALLFLGPKRLPEAGRSLGRGIREFKDGITGNDDDPRGRPTRPRR